MSKSPTRKLSRKKIFYVYALLDPRKPGPFYYGHWKFPYEPFYVGKGKEDRSSATLINDGRNPHKHNKIAKIRREGYEPIVLIKRGNLTEKQSFEIEVLLIDKIGRSNLQLGPLTNLTNGGEGASGWKPTRKTLSRMCIAQQNMSIETKLKIGLSNRVALRGLVKSEEHKAKISASNLGKNSGLKRSAETKAKLSKAKKGINSKSRKPIKIHNKIYFSLTEAAIVLKVPRSTLGDIILVQKLPGYSYVN